MKCGYLNESAGDGFAVIPENKDYRFQFLFMKYQGNYFMKKTLIALAVAASVVMPVFNTAYASTDKFSGGNISLGGTISAQVPTYVYKGTVGTLSELNVTINAGEQNITIPVQANAGLVSLRTVTEGVESTTLNKIANITFDGRSLLEAASDNSFNNGKINMTLEARNSSGEAIGNVVFPMQVAGVAVTVDKTTSDAYGASLFSPDNNRVFYGGLPVEKTQAVQGYTESVNLIKKLFSELANDLPQVSTQGVLAESKDFSNSNKTFHAITDIKGTLRGRIG